MRSPQVWSFTASAAKSGFGPVNTAALALYLLAVVAVGAAFTRRNKSTDDFFRGGQRVPWWAAGLSIFATMLSSITFMAIPARAYSTNWELYLANSYVLITPLVTLVFLRFYRSLDVTSAYEYLERRFNAATRMIASGLFILFQGGRVAVVLLLPSLALATVSNLDVTACVIVMGVLCVVYTVLGGIEAVIWTDVAQAVVLLGGAVWALAALAAKVDGGPSELLAVAHAQGKFFETVAWSPVWASAGWAIIVGSLFHNLFPYTASQDVVQRYVTTSDQRGAARAIWLNMLLSVPAQAVFFAIGTALFVFYRQHPERLDPTLPTDSIFPLFIVRELPVGVAGLIVAGIFAAAQSTLSSSLNSTATAYVTDFHRRFRPGADDASRLRLARWLTAVVGLAGTAAAVVLARSDVRSLWEAFLSILGLFGGTITGLFLLGIFSRRANSGGAIAGAVASAAIVGYVARHKLVHFYCYALVGLVACVTVGWAMSRLWPGPGDPDGMTIYSLRRNR